MSENAPRHDRDGTIVKGKRIMHSTLRRDWCCGVCGSALSTQHWPITGWLTICAEDHTHDPDQFITRASWDYVQAQRQMDRAKASEVLAHLPADLRAVITE